MAVTRRYYRSGRDRNITSTRQSVRLKDVNELFMDTGMGREGYSIIGQGKIDEILSVKSGERREVFEEAAGISKYRHRKEEAERKLERTQENLVRINDKIAELELQVEPLRRAGGDGQRSIWCCGMSCGCWRSPCGWSSCRTLKTAKLQAADRRTSSAQADQERGRRRRWTPPTPPPRH